MQRKGLFLTAAGLSITYVGEKYLKTGVASNFDEDLNIQIKN